jgi:opacity protein-like surface antigen
MKRITSAAFAACFLMLGSAQAQQMQMPQWTTAGLYGELGYTVLKVDALGTSFRPNALRGIVGYDASPYFAIEGMGAWGINEDDKNISIGGISTNTEVKLDYMYGILAKPKYMPNPQTELFGRFGWAHTKVKLKRTGLEDSEGQDDFAWGIGANYRFNPNGYVGIDWMRYSNQSDSHVDGLTVSVGWHW